MKVISLFAGAGGLDLGFQKAGYDIIWANEFDKTIWETFEKNHPDTPLDRRSITDIPEEDIPRDVEGIVGGPPCFAPGTLVLTISGYIPIEDIQEGDLVMTHLGRWRKVTSTMARESDSTLVVSHGGSCGDIVTTDEHPFYVRQRDWQYDRFPCGSMAKRRQMLEPEWVEAGDLSKDHFAGQVLPQEEIQDDHSEEFWWLVGLYLADGWLRKVYPNKKKKYTITICANSNESQEVSRRIKQAGMHACRCSDRTVDKYQIADKSFHAFLEQFGTGAHGKHIPGWVLQLSTEKVRAVMDGYIFGDGCRLKNGNISMTTVSPRLALMVSLCCQKAYGIVSTTSINRRPETCVIEGRTVSQSDTFAMRMAKKNRVNFIEGDYAWRQIKSVKPGEPSRVYNISVEEDESYVVHNTIVHNCQSFSLAGSMRGLDDKRGRLMLDYIRVLRHVKPAWFVLENVPGLVSRTHLPTFLTILQYLSQEGYEVSHSVLNANDYGVPQDRKRVIVVGMRGTSGFDFEAIPMEPNKPTLADAFKGLPEPIEVPQNSCGEPEPVNHEYASGDFSSHYMSRQRVRSWDEPSFTIQASARHQPLHPQASPMIFVEKDKWRFDPDSPKPYRRFSVREAARVQTFPDDFVFHYSRCANGYKMIGNAVPVELARRLALGIQDYF